MSEVIGILLALFGQNELSKAVEELRTEIVRLRSISGDVAKLNDIASRIDAIVQDLAFYSENIGVAVEVLKKSCGSALYEAIRSISIGDFDAADDRAEVKVFARPDILDEYVRAGMGLRVEVVRYEPGK